eukprot:GHVU01130521.1.p1 GENE.GHVU01130521.1~~GHVU01130521.1.p1  ORF type:complete len:167 (-),score=20.20 GHVU01130521.1:669-1169(-)
MGPRHTDRKKEPTGMFAREFAGEGRRTRAHLWLLPRRPSPYSNSGPLQCGLGAFSAPSSSSAVEAALLLAGPVRSDGDTEHPQLAILNQLHPPPPPPYIRPPTSAHIRSHHSSTPPGGTLLMSHHSFIAQTGTPRMVDLEKLTVALRLLINQQINSSTPRWLVVDC